MILELVFDDSLGFLGSEACNLVESRSNIDGDLLDGPTQGIDALQQLDVYPQGQT